MSDNEIQAQDLIKRGEIDEAISIYQQLTPESARILSIIGTLYAEKKGDYDRAINYHEKALQLREEVNIQRKIHKNTIRSLKLSFFFSIER